MKALLIIACLFSSPLVFAFDLHNAYQSPIKVGAKDREGWLSLWADDATVQDPVGGMTHGIDGHTLGKFWDTFISGRDIRFDVKKDYLLGNALVRDVIITTDTHGLVVEVPAILRYRVNAAGMIISMEAFWEIIESSKPLLTGGTSAISLLSDFTYRLAKNQGLDGLMSMTGSYLTRGLSKRKERTRTLLQNLAKGEKPERLNLAITPAMPPEFLASHFIDAKITGDMIAAGKFVTFKYTNQDQTSVGILEFKDDGAMELSIYHKQIPRNT